METRLERLKAAQSKARLQAQNTYTYVPNQHHFDEDGSIAAALRDIEDLKYSLQLASEDATLLANKIVQHCDDILPRFHG
jgi:hypothetical protein